MNSISGHIHMEVKLDINDLLDAIFDSNIDYVTFIKALDEKLCNWDITNELYNYFKELHKEYLEESGKTEEDVSITEKS